MADELKRRKHTQVARTQLVMCAQAARGTGLTRGRRAQREGRRGGKSAQNRSAKNQTGRCAAVKVLSSSSF